MGFTKLDSGILDSSIWSEPLATRVVWIAFLAKSNKLGFVAASRTGMIRAANVTEEEFDQAVATLEAPDTDSRSPEHGGRRIQKVEGGWKVLNYEKYRLWSYSQATESVRKREYRRRKKENAAGHVPDTSGTRPGKSGGGGKGGGKGKPDQAALEAVMSLWNTFAKKHNLAQILEIKPRSTREARLRARMREPGFDFAAVLADVESQPFLLGENDQGWSADFDWLLSPSNYAKVRERKYLRRRRNTVEAWSKK